MILFNTNFECKLENVVTDSDGRYLICTVVVNNEQIVLGNYYGLNSDELYLLEDFCNKVNQFDDLPMILGGDWNMAMDKIDKKGDPWYYVIRKTENDFVNSLTEMI